MMRFALAFLLLIISSLPSLAAEPDYSNFSRIPMQHEGRIKPIDTVARIYLKNFSGRENLKGMDHNAWLAEALFDPAQSMQRPAFRLFRPELLNLPEKEGRLYSYTELIAALRALEEPLKKLRETEPADWSEDQSELARLQDYSILYTQMLRSFSLILPLNITPPPELAKEWKIPQDTNLTLQDIRKYRERLDGRIKIIIRNKGDNPDRYSDSEKQIVAFAFEMEVLFSAGEKNVLMRLIPTSWDQDGEWLSPWALTQTGKGSPQTAEMVTLWQNAAKAYVSRDAGLWEKSTGDIRNAMDQHIVPTRLSVEIFYNTVHPLQSAMMFFLGSFLLFCGWIVSSKRVCYRISAGLLAGGLVLNGLAIVCRILILGRPPVGTLYESILFVSLICVAVTLMLEYRRKDGNGLLTGSIAGGLLLFLAEGFAEDDSLRMLVAVLNTNFWLGTHVLCITIGYGLCLITAGYAHLYMIRALYRKEGIDVLGSSIRTLSLLSLLFTAIGTILGGIWADQSWGRFWGWDPKENGALLIVLWLIWILHGQMSGHLRTIPYMAATAFLSVVVALAWFGVNLLSVGLHSYGFTTGVTAGLIIFCAAEILIIGFLWYKNKKGQAS